MAAEVTEKQLKILLVLLEENEELDLSTLTAKLKEKGVDTHINYVRHVTKLFSEKGYVDFRGQSIGKRTFYLVEPRYDPGTFERLLKLFFKSDHRLKFVQSKYTQEMINEKLVEHYLRGFWDIINTEDEPLVKLKEAILGLSEQIRQQGVEIEAQKEKLIEPILGYCKESPLVLYALVFPKETATEVKSLVGSLFKGYDALATALGPKGEEYLKMIIKEISTAIEERGKKLSGTPK